MLDQYIMNIISVISDPIVIVGIESMKKIKSKCHHTKCPEGYLQWHAWAEQKSKKHTCFKCLSCGKFAVWKRTSTVIKKISTFTGNIAELVKQRDDYLSMFAGFGATPLPVIETDQVEIFSKAWWKKRLEQVEE